MHAAHVLIELSVCIASCLVVDKTHHYMTARSRSHFHSLSLGTHLCVYVYYTSISKFRREASEDSGAARTPCCLRKHNRVVRKRNSGSLSTRRALERFVCARLETPGPLEMPSGRFGAPLALESASGFRKCLHCFFVDGLQCRFSAFFVSGNAFSVTSQPQVRSKVVLGPASVATVALESAAQACFAATMALKSAARACFVATMALKSAARASSVATMALKSAARASSVATMALKSAARASSVATKAPESAV